MARCRIISPTHFQNEILAELPIEARWLYLGLFTEADREGRLEDRPVRLKAVLLPYDAHVDIEAALKGLAARGLITRYTVDGAKYISLPAFFDNQRPHVREAASRIPPAPESTNLGIAEDDPRTSLGSDQATPRCPGSVPVSVSDPVSVTGTVSDSVPVSVNGRGTGTGGRAPRGSSKAAGDGRLLQAARQVLKEHPTADQDELVDYLQYVARTMLSIQVKRQDAIDCLKAVS